MDQFSGITSPWLRLYLNRRTAGAATRSFRDRHTQSSEFPARQRTTILASMTQPAANCVLLANRHHRLIESVRDMLEAEFEALFIVATESSLIEGATRLQPTIVVADLSLVPRGLPQLLARLRTCSPSTKLLLLSTHDQASVARFALESGADGVVLVRSIATDLHPAVDALLADQRFVSPGIGAGP